MNRRNFASKTLKGLVAALAAAMLPKVTADNLAPSAVGTNSMFFHRSTEGEPCLTLITKLSDGSNLTECRLVSEKMFNTWVPDATASIKNWKSYPVRETVTLYAGVDAEALIEANVRLIRQSLAARNVQSPEMDVMCEAYRRSVRQRIVRTKFPSTAFLKNPLRDA